MIVPYYDNLSRKTLTLKALVFTTKKNLDALASMDTRVVAYGLERAGYQVDLKELGELRENVDAVPFEDYDVISYAIPDNALYASTAKNYHFYKEMVKRAKPYAICLFQCDITFALDPFIWDPTQGRAETRFNYLKEKPVRVIASFSDSILEDPIAMELMNKKYMSKLHPDSKLVPVEWLSFNYDMMVKSRGGEPGSNIADLPARYTELPDVSAEVLPIGKFYYGIKKPKIARRLKELGLGENPNDAVFGKVGENLPNVRNFLTNKKDVGREFWLPYVRAAQEVILPYEPIKGDHQITLRYLEALEFYPNTVFDDPKTASWIADAARDYKVWIEAQNRAIKRYKGLVEL